jgi:hypothetical protein
MNGLSPPGGFATYLYLCPKQCILSRPCGGRNPEVSQNFIHFRGHLRRCCILEVTYIHAYTHRHQPCFLQFTKPETSLGTLSTLLISPHREYNTPYPLAQSCISRSPLLNSLALHFRFPASGETGPSEGERTGGIVVSGTSVANVSAVHLAVRHVGLVWSSSISSFVGGRDSWFPNDQQLGLQCSAFWFHLPGSSRMAVPNVSGFAGAASWSRVLDCQKYPSVEGIERL